MGILARWFALVVIVLWNAQSAFAKPWKSYDESVRTGGIQRAAPVFEILLAFDSQRDPSVRIEHVAVKNGHRSAAIGRDFGTVEFRLQALDAAGRLLEELSFAPPTFLAAPPPRPGEKASHTELYQKSVEFTLTLPAHPTAETIQITSMAGQTLASSRLSGARDRRQAPRFDSIPGDQFMADTSANRSTSWIGGMVSVASSLWSRIVTPARGGSSDGVYVDIAFIGDLYSAGQMGMFRSDVDRMIQNLLSYEPFKSRAGQLRFHVIDNTTSLNCAPSPSMSRLLLCDTALAQQLVNSSGAPWDRIAILVNTPNYGGSGGFTSVSYNGTSGDQVFVHEFGHSLAALRDEYTLYSSNGTLTNTTDRNCLAGPPPAAAWSNLVSNSQYTLGCMYPNWYRSSPSSVMLTLSTRSFNPVSQVLLGSSITQFAGPPGSPTPSPSPTPTSTPSPDLTAPTVSITSPVNGSRVSRTVQISVDARDQVGVVRVDIYLDGALKATSSTAPFTTQINFRKVASGTHLLTARAYDAAGNMGTSASITVSK